IFIVVTLGSFTENSIHHSLCEQSSVPKPGSQHVLAASGVLPMRSTVLQAAIATRRRRTTPARSLNIDHHESKGDASRAFASMGAQPRCERAPLAIHIKL